MHFSKMILVCKFFLSFAVFLKTPQSLDIVNYLRGPDWQHAFAPGGNTISKFT